MGLRLPDFPSNLSENDCYHFLMDEHKKGVDTWMREDLVHEFGLASVKELENEDILKVTRGGKIKLTFSVLGTVTEMITEFATKEVCSVWGLLSRFSNKANCSPVKIRDQLVYLKNFDKVQTMDLPGTALTVVAGETPEAEKQLDEIFSMSDRIEKKFVYRAPTDKPLMA